MGLNRINTCSQYSDKEGQQRRTRNEVLPFLFVNRKKLNNTRNGSKYIEAIENLSKQHAPFTDKQLSYINEVLYEKVMGAAGFEEAKTTYKHNNRSNLRYGSR